MKPKLITLVILMFLSIGAFSQTKKGPTPVIKDTIKVTGPYYFTEDQMITLFNILRVARNSPLILNSDRVTTSTANKLTKFNDSLCDIFVTQSEKWHPDTTAKKVDSTKH